MVFVRVRVVFYLSMDENVGIFGRCHWPEGVAVYVWWAYWKVLAGRGGVLFVTAK